MKQHEQNNDWPECTWGGYNNFRILSYHDGVTDPIEFYNQIKELYDKGLHVLIHIHRGNQDVGIHSHRLSNSDTFEIHDLSIAYTLGTLNLYRYVFKPTGVNVSHKEIKLETIWVKQD